MTNLEEEVGGANTTVSTYEVVHLSLVLQGNMLSAITFKKNQLLTTVGFSYKPRLHGPSANTTDLMERRTPVEQTVHRTGRNLLAFIFQHRRVE